MAFHDTHAIAPRDILHSVYNGIVSFFSSLGHSVVMASEARRRLEVVENLQARSDQELAALGLKREDIVRHVFNDLYYS
ncbi:DUF1127 domain-containing protein [uncultured Roseobacter sp.]|uniref:DUF1127 domain-containing protein n=1 Tax=uncultured Roseobacter sp. TaxID=114847 RepID=UPI002603A02D|nr:DUF1127 domain-containing protein [uncultured Roseobacter sp.]